MAAHLLIFGDDQADKVSTIRNLYKISTSRLQLRQFLQVATDIVQLNLSKLAAAHERLSFGQFDSLLDLAESVEAAELPEATACAVLITAAQIGELLCIAEDDTSILSRYSDVYPLGFCIGLLAASVAAGGRDTSELVRLGAEVVGISLRLGLELRRRAHLIEHSSKGWSTVILASKCDVERGLENFNESLPSLRKAYGGVISSAWTTIFGPPSTIAALATHTMFEKFPKVLHTGTTAIHASHLPPVDIDEILGNSPLLDGMLAHRPVFSCSTCSPFQATTVKDLLEHAVVDISSRPLWPEKIAGALIDTLKTSEVVLTQVGPSNYTPMVKRLLQNRQMIPRLSAPGQMPPPKPDSRAESMLIAIVGMSGRFPGCNDDLEDFWDLLAHGRPVHEEVPPSRFILEEHFDPKQTIKNAVLNRFGCFLKSPGLFDHSFFKVSPREAMQMDPLHRMFLMTTYEALEQAGYGGTNSNSTQKGRISTFFSQTTDDWRTINDQQGTDTHYAPCSNRAFASGRVAHHFGWSGAAYSIDTACSSSATAIHLACNALVNRESDTAIVGGGSLCVTPEPFSGLAKGGFLSLSAENGSCKTFQEAADGYCRGEGVGVVVLKRLKDAVVEEDNILAVVRCSARNGNIGAASIAHPSEAAQETLFREILRKSHIDPNEIGFIEMHGTGTQAGDQAEMNSVCKVFAQNRAADNPLYVGAVKACIGHSEAAAGVISLIKTVLMLRHGGAITPQPGYPFVLNKKFGDLAAVNIKIADGRASLQPWPKGDGTRKVLINSFDAAGGNTSLLIQDAPERRPRSSLSRRCHLVTISGRTATALSANRARLRAFLLKNPSIDIGDVAYTTTARRLHEVQREAFVSSSVTELCELLAQEQSDKFLSSDPQSLVFVFTGEGSLYAGMGSTLYQTAPSFRRILNSLQAASESQGQRANFLDIIRGHRDMAQVSTPERQMAIVALEIALAQYWQSLGLSPSMVMGHSLGEYAALCVAGVLSITDTLRLVYERGTLIEHHCRADSYAMLAIAEAEVKVRRYLDRISRSSCEISCVNGPHSTVVSGTRDDIGHLECLLRDENIKTAVLPVRFGFHSAQMDPVVSSLGYITDTLVFAKPLIPVASTALAKIVTDEGVFGSAYLASQMRQCVHFARTIEASQDAGLIRNGSNLIEVGPRPICADFVAKSLQNVSINFWGSLQQGGDDWQAINAILARAYVARTTINWQEFYRHHLQEVQLIDLPPYAFDLTNFWHPYHAFSTGKHFPADSSNTLPYTGVQFLRSIDADKGTADFSSSTANPVLSSAIQGHLVDGIPICPVSVLADMAVTAAVCFLQRTGAPAYAASFEIVNMNMDHPLVAHKSSDTWQNVRIHAELRKSRQEVAIAFSSKNRGRECELGACIVRLHSSSTPLIARWEHVQELVKDQVQALKQDGRAGVAHHMNCLVTYKLFGSVVEYSKEYMAIRETFVASDFGKGAAVVDLQKTLTPGHFTLNPFAVDALVHLAGFLLNADFSKPANEIYIATHLESLHVAENLSAMTRQVCTCFATVRKKASDTQAACEVYVYDDQKPIAVCSVHFRRIHRDVFRSTITKIDDPSLPYGGPRTLHGQSNATMNGMGKRYNIDASDGFVSSEEHTSARKSHPLEVYELLANTLARHTGIDASDIRPSSRLADLGIDSLMALAVLGDLEKTATLSLPAGFFTRLETIAEAVNELELLMKPLKACRMTRDLVTHGATGSREATNANCDRPCSDASVTSECMSTSSNTIDIPLVRTVNDQEVSLETLAQKPRPVNSNSAAESACQVAETKAEMSAFVTKSPSVADGTVVQEWGSLVARSVLIQGEPGNNERPLFLITDGSGGVTGYIHFPALPGNRKIYALESPFVERPSEYTLSIGQMAQVFIRTIKKHQPHGPYLVGGWSAGSIYAYEICYQLAQQGEIINGLILIDMAITRPVVGPCGVDMALVEKTGVLTGVDRATNSPLRLLELQKMHIACTVRAVAQYKPVPFPEGKEPIRTHLIWATKGLTNSLTPEEHGDCALDGLSTCLTCIHKASPDMTLRGYAIWLKNLLNANRTHLGTNGWERLVGDNIQVTSVEGDHFSIVRPPHVEQLGGVILDAVAMDAELGMRLEIIM